MNGSPTIETDYLLVGAGALGMGFADTLVDNTDADIVIVDRRSAPGGHWLDAYPFVQLHQPSMNYGVNSTALGRDRIDDGRDAGFYERASGAEIRSYYDDLMRHRFSATKRVRFFPMCDYLGDRRIRSRLSGALTEVSVRRRVVDATYMASRVPGSDPPPFEVAEGATCVPVGALARVTETPAGYVIVGGGKTAMDAICWLLDRGTPPSLITWIRPRDSWILNRAFFQPGNGVVATFEGVVVELEAVAECDSIDQVYQRLEQHDVTLRTDRSVAPTMLKGATASLGEVEQLQRIENVVRLGHVDRIGLDAIDFEHGSIATSRDHLHVHSASAGLSDNPPRAIFDDDIITLQPITRASLSLSAALSGFVEASDRPTAEKNRLCPPNSWFQTPFDFTRHLLTGMKTELEWQSTPDISTWVDNSRLNLMKSLPDDPDTVRVAALQARFLTALFPALDKLELFAARATPAERARIFAPAPAA